MHLIFRSRNLFNTCCQGYAMLPNLLVINCYVFPLHRTARGDNVGTALSFVTANDDKILKKAEEELTKEFTGTRNIILLVLHSDIVLCYTPV